MLLADRINVMLVISSEDLGTRELSQLAAGIGQLLYLNLRVLVLLANLVLLATELVLGLQALLHGIHIPNPFMGMANVLLGQMRGLMI
jgi:hypothetical protein